jgi:outer membrane protein OmpA-like peptidoglycan-associated protein
MRARWRLGMRFGEAEIATWIEAGGAEGQRGAVPTVVAELPRWAGDTTGALWLREMFEALEGAPTGRLLDVHRDVIPVVESGLHDGRLVVLALRDLPLLVPPMLDPKSEPPPPPGPPPKTDETWFEVKLVDEVGDPIGDVDLSINIIGKNNETKKTSGGGVVRIDPVDASFAQVAIKDIEALRDKMRGRWSKPRKAKIPSGQAVFTRELTTTVEAVAIENEVPATIVITPFFRCNEIAGAHFDFGRSFVRRDAVGPLASIAEDLEGEPIRKAMIFTHTDKSGSDALNKELSERRAKAIHALFTHDAGAWEDLFTNKWSGGNWSEQWGTKEVQHMLNAVHCGDDAGAALTENGVRDAATIQAIKRFQRGDYPDVPAEQAPLETDGDPGPKTRKELFLAYAKRVSRKPVPADRFAKVNGEKYMGCGEFNPLSISAKDEQSRRGVVFIFDNAAEPQGLPCKLQSMGPCKANVSPEPKEPDPDGKPPYRCKIYKEVAVLCPCNGGADLAHDLVIQLPYTLQQANQMPQILIVESEDGTITMTKTLKADARAHDAGFSEIYFNDLPPHHSYRMRCEGVDTPYEVFGLTPYEKLSTLAIGPNALDPNPFLS